MGGEYLSVSDKLRWVLEWTDHKLNSKLETRTYSHTHTWPSLTHTQALTLHTLQGITVTDKKENPMMSCHSNFHSLGGQIFLYMWAKITQYVRISSFILHLITLPAIPHQPTFPQHYRPKMKLCFHFLSQNMIPTGHLPQTCKAGFTVMKSI